ncbi:coiled-coil domain-containing protein 120 isoform X1 [Triplophysa rosa]|uniref:Coiled-coil domain containing 120 n=1 Tax=Triplophysa rosa TaxID=992332 RepID=A0A9W7TCQ5_TRIRA|nr:coiled-coil domain-containing protein 120 isoform X1 [Triplophysa rosa]XP_057218631.1 coiled-coil domain-containing protein 120 isoform X1 [Triplophysa rosa]XP_057218632.1 coiled-coil domain-containing protein 120 isoform X1 [Triplophysa rosa]KAI7794892.1 coiled-coil domain containing 120 [Triplophysa rosa]
MEVKGRLITAMGLGAPDVQGCQDSKLQGERVSELQERKRSLQSLLNSRLGELRQVCLQEAELTGKLPRDFPLEAGERPPFVQRRTGLAPYVTSKGEDDPGQRRQMKALFSGALRRSIESDKNMLYSKRTVHRGCHTEETVKSESSSMSDSTSHDNEDSSPSVAPEHRSLSHPRLAPGSPDSRLCRKLSPVEIYYEMRTRRNSASSSVSPSHSLPRSASNVEGRSVPATPLLSRTAPISVHVRPEMPGGIALKQWCGSPDVPQFVPLAPLEGSSSERRSCPYSSRARRSNSSEALLDRSSLPEPGPPRNGMPPRAGPYKSSESLTDGKLRQMYQGSPERQMMGFKEQGRMRSSLGGQSSGTGYNEILMDYIWGKQQKRPVQPQQNHSAGRIWPDFSTPPSGTPPHYNGFSHSQLHLAAAPPSYSPMLLRGQEAEPRRVKVTRTKSCGPFIPLQPHQQDTVLFSAYDLSHPSSGSTTSSIPNLLPHHADLTTAAAFGRRPPQFSLPTPEDSTRSLHKALALEGLRDWYLRNALGYSTTAKGHDGLGMRHSHTHHLVHQPQSIAADPLYSHRQIPQSASFHGHPLHARSVELSLYPEPFPSEGSTQKESGSEPPSPGTLV